MMNRDLIHMYSIVIREVITMQVQPIVQQLLQVVCPTMHRVRRASLAASALGALRGRRLTVTAIGRALPGGTSQKHAIKRADRLLSNRHLHAQRVQHYQDLCRLFIGARTRPVLLIDWSDLDACKRHFLLRASLAVNSRSITVYEEVHTFENEGEAAHAPGVSATVAGIVAGRLPTHHRDRCGLSHALVSTGGVPGVGIGSDGYATGTRCVGAVGDAGLVRNAVINGPPAWPSTWARPC